MSAAAVAEIRFSDVASYVGLALHASRSSSNGGGNRTLPPKASQRERVPFALPGVAPGTSSPSKPSRGRDELPPIVAAQADRVRSQLHLLQVEQSVQREQVRKLETSLSDSLLVEKKAKQRAAKHRELHDHHKKRALRVEREIEKLRSELDHMHTAAAQQPQAAAPPAAAQPAPLQAGGSTGSRDLCDEEEVVSVAEEAFPPSPGSKRRSPKSRKSKGSRAGSSGASSVGSPGTPVGGDASSPKAASASASAAAAEEAEQQEQEEEPTGPSAAEKKVTLVLPSEADAKGAPPQGSGAVSSSSAAASPVAPPPAILAAAARDSQEEEEDDENPLVYFRSLGKHESKLTNEERRTLAELRRAVVRKEMKASAGGARQAFKTIDLNGSGSISSQEFVDGVQRLGVQWQHLTGMTKPREFFKLFDDDRDHVITFRELFPEDHALERSGQVRASTPDFCKRYRRQKEHAVRPPEWQPAGPDEELERLFSNMAANEQSAHQRQWISSTMRRMQGRGKSAARCRELVALHLPKGTGPRDRQGVHTISTVDLRKIRQTYSDDLQGPIREATKTMGDLRELRREQKQIIDKLYKVTEAENARARAQEQAVSGLGFNSGGLSLFGKSPSMGSLESPAAAAQQAAVAQQQAAAARRGGPKTVEDIAKELGMPESQLDDVLLEFERLVGKGSNLTNKVFSKLLKVLAPARTCSEDDLTAWWTQIAREVVKQKAEGKGKGTAAASEEKKEGETKAEKRPTEDSRKAQVNFEQFARWYASSEIRTKYVPTE